MDGLYLGLYLIYLILTFCDIGVRLGLYLSFVSLSCSFKANIRKDDIQMTLSLFARHGESSVDGFRGNRVDVYKLCFISLFISTNGRSEGPVDSLVPI